LAQPTKTSAEGATKGKTARAADTQDASKREPEKPKTENSAQTEAREREAIFIDFILMKEGRYCLLL
jgi:hypothetical protein